MLFLVPLGYFLEESQCLDFFRSLDWIDFVTSAPVSGSALLSCSSVVFHQRTAIKFHENPHSDDLKFVTPNPTHISPWEFSETSFQFIRFVVVCSSLYLSLFLSLSIFLCYISIFTSISIFYIRHIYTSIPISINTSLSPLPPSFPMYRALSLYIYVHISLYI